MTAFCFQWSQKNIVLYCSGYNYIGFVAMFLDESANPAFALNNKTAPVIIADDFLLTLGGLSCEVYYVGADMLENAAFFQ